MQAPLAGMNVSFTPEIDAQLLTLENVTHISKRLSAVLAQDPRPAYRKEEQAGKRIAVITLDFNVRWRVTASVLKSLPRSANFIFLSFGICHTGKLNHFFVSGWAASLFHSFMEPLQHAY
ncbi:hypothetical protein ACL655_02685 [Klebsiella quasipneumoniae subsp. similipneumoniae]